MVDRRKEWRVVGGDTEFGLETADWEDNISALSTNLHGIRALTATEDSLTGVHVGVTASHCTNTILLWKQEEIQRTVILIVSS